MCWRRKETPLVVFGRREREEERGREKKREIYREIEKDKTDWQRRERER